MAEWVGALATIAAIAYYFVQRHGRVRERRYLEEFHALETLLADALASGDIERVNLLAARLRDLRTTYSILAR